MDTLSSLKLFSYSLPEERIAHSPLLKRDNAKLLIVDRKTGNIRHMRFFNLPSLLTPRDVLVLNESRVFPARIRGKKPTGGKVELLLIRHIEEDIWECISRPGLKPGSLILFPQSVKAKVLRQEGKTGEIAVKFHSPHASFFDALQAIGQTPIPSYIHAPLSEQELRSCYQTVFAKSVGSAAAPTAGLHFTNDLLKAIQAKGVQVEYITLHVGLGTFQSLREEHFKQNALHKEYLEVNPYVAKRLIEAKKDGKRVIAVGTTTTRTLESAATKENEINPNFSETTLFIRPPYRFRFIDSMITNFHLPESSLLMLISAFASDPNTNHIFTQFSDSVIGKAYQEAIKNDYRFYSFGDAMWIA